MASMKSLSRDPLTEWERMVNTNIESMQGSCPFLADTRSTKSGCAVLNSTLDNFSQESYQKTVNSDDKIIFRDILGKDIFENIGCNKMETFQHLEGKRDAGNIDYDDKQAGRRISEEKQYQIIENEEWSCTNLDINNESYTSDNQKHMHTHIKSVDMSCNDLQEYVDTFESNFDGVFLNKHVGSCEDSEFQLFTLDPSLIISDTAHAAKRFLGGLEITGTYIHMTDQTSVDTVEECTSFGGSVEISEVQPPEERFGGYTNEECVTEKLSFKSCMKTNIDTIQTDELNCVKKDLSSTGDLCSRRINSKDVSNNKICSTALGNGGNKTRHLSNERMKINDLNNAETSSINFNIGRSRARDFSIASMTGVSSSAVPTDCALKANNVTPVEIEVQYGRALCCGNDYDASSEIQIRGVTVVEGEGNLVKEFSCEDGFSQGYSSLENRQAGIVGPPLLPAGLYKQNRMQKWFSEENIVVGKRRRLERKCTTNIGKSETFDMISSVDVEMSEHFISRARSTGERCKRGHIEHVGFVSRLHMNKDPIESNNPQHPSLIQSCTKGGSEAEACTKGGSEAEACTKGGSEDKACTKGGSETEACTKGGSEDEACTKGGSEAEACTKGGSETEACTKGGSETEACTKGGSETEACTKGGSETEACTKGGSEAEACTKCAETEACTKGGSETEACTKGGSETEACTKGGSETEACTKGGSEAEACAKCAETEACTKSNRTEEYKSCTKSKYLTRNPMTQWKRLVDMNVESMLNSAGGDVHRAGYGGGDFEVVQSKAKDCCGIAFEKTTVELDKLLNSTLDLTAAEWDTDTCCQRFVDVLISKDGGVGKDVCNPATSLECLLHETVCPGKDKLVNLDKEDNCASIVITNVERDSISDCSQMHISERKTNFERDILSDLWFCGEEATGVPDKLLCLQPTEPERDLSNVILKTTDFINSKSKIKDQSSKKVDLRNLNSGNSSLRALKNKNVNTRDLNNGKANTKDLNKGRFNIRDQGNQKGDIRDLNSGITSVKYLSKENASQRDLSNEKSSLGHLSNEKSSLGHLSNEKSSLRDLSNEKSHTRDQSNGTSYTRDLSNGKSHTRDVSNGKYHTRDVSNGKSHTRDLSNGKSHTRDLSNGKSHTRDVSNGKSHTRDQSNEKSHTRNLSNGKSRPRDLSTVKNHTRDVSNEKSHTRDLINGQSHTRDSINEKSQTRDLNNEKYHTKDLSNENPHSRDLSNGKCHTRDLSNGKSHTRDVGNGKSHTRDLSNGKSHTRDVGNKKSHTRDVVNGKSHTRDVGNGKSHTRDVGNGKSHTRDLSNEKSHTRNLSNGKSHTRDPSTGKNHTRDLSNGESHTRDLSNEKSHTRNLSNGKYHTRDLSKEKFHTRDLSNRKSSRPRRDLSSGKPSRRDLSNGESHKKESINGQINARDMRSEKSSARDMRSEKSSARDMRSEKSSARDMRSEKSSARDMRSEKSSARDMRSEKSSARDMRSEKSSARDLSNEKPHLKEMINKQSSTKDMSNSKSSRRALGNGKAGIEDLSNEKSNTRYVSSIQSSTRDPSNGKAGIEDLSNEKSNTRYVSSIQSSTRDPSNGRTTAINVGKEKISTAALGNGKASTKDKSKETTSLGDHSKGRKCAKNLSNFKVDTGESNKCRNAEKCIKSSNTDKASVRNLSKERSYTENITSRDKNLGNFINAVAKTWDQSCTNVSARDLNYKETSTRDPSEDRTSVIEFNNGTASQRDLGNGTVSAKDLGNIADDIICLINCDINQVGQHNVGRGLSKDTANVRCSEIQIPGVTVVEGEWNPVKDFSCGDGFSQGYSSLENRQADIVGSPLHIAGLYKQNRMQKWFSEENIVVGNRRGRKRKCRTNIGKSGTFDMISSIDVEMPERFFPRARSTGERCKRGHIENVGFVSGLHMKKDPIGNNKPQPPSLIQSCTKGGSEAEACTKGGSETEACTKGGSEAEACTKGGSEAEACTKGGSEAVACTKGGNETEACTKGGNETEACTKGGNETEACTKGGNETEACTKGGSETEACTKRGSEAEACTKGNETEACTKGNETEACVKGNETESCTKGAEIEVCTKGNETETYTKGAEIEVCTKGNETEACKKSNRTEEYKSCKKSKYLTRNPMTQWKRLVDMNVESMLNSAGGDVHRAGYGGGDFEAVQSKAKDCYGIALEKTTVEIEPSLNSTLGLTAAEWDIDKWCQSFDDISKDEDIGKDLDDATMSPEYFSYETFISPTADFPKNELFLEINNDMDILCSASFFGQEAPKVIKELENLCAINQISSQCEMNLCAGNSDEIVLLDSKASLISVRNSVICDLSISKIPQLGHDKADFKQKEIEETNAVVYENDSVPKTSLALTGGNKSFVEMSRTRTTTPCFKEEECASNVITNLEMDSISNYSHKHIYELNHCEKDTISTSGFYDKGHAKWPGTTISLEQIESSLDKCNRTEDSKCDLANTDQSRPTYNLDVVKQINKINDHKDVPSDQLPHLQVQKCYDQISNNLSTKCTSADIKVIEVLDELELPSEIDNKPPVWSRFSNFMRNMFGSSSKVITQEVNDINQSINAKKSSEKIKYISSDHTKKSNAVLEAVKNNSHSQNGSVNHEQRSFSKENKNIGASYKEGKQEFTSISNRSLSFEDINAKGQTKLAPNSLFPDIADSEIGALNELNANTDITISEMNLNKDQLREGYLTSSLLTQSNGSDSLDCKLHVMHAEAGCELFHEGFAKTQCSIVREICVEGNKHNQSLQSKNRILHSKSKIPTLISSSHSRTREFRSMSKHSRAQNEDDVEKCTLENSHRHDIVQSGGKGQAYVGSCQAKQGQLLNPQEEGQNNVQLNEETNLVPEKCSEYKNKFERNSFVCKTEYAERNVEKCFAESSNILLSRTDVLFSAVQYYVVPQVTIRVEDEECTIRQNKIKENVSTFFETQSNEVHNCYSNGVKLDCETDPMLDVSLPVPSCCGEENPELVGGSDLLQSSLECLLEMLLQRGKVIQAVVADIDGDVIAKTANLELTARDMKGLACGLSSTYQGIAKLAVFNDVYTCFKHDHNSVLIGTASTRMFVAQRGKQSIVVGFTDPHTPGSCIKEVQELSRLLHKRGL